MNKYYIYQSPREVVQDLQVIKEIAQLTGKENLEKLMDAAIGYINLFIWGEEQKNEKI